MSNCDPSDLQAVFDTLECHDARILKVERVSGHLLLTLDAILRSGTVPPRRISPARFLFLEVLQEKAWIWHNDQTPEPHPLPFHPLVEIMQTSRNQNTYVLEGFSNTHEWSEWHIKASRFVLENICEN